MSAPREQGHRGLTRENPHWLDFIEHEAFTWRARALAAEAENERLREALSRILDGADPWVVASAALEASSEPRP